MHSPIAAMVVAEALVPRSEDLATARERRTWHRAVRRLGRRPMLPSGTESSAFHVRRPAAT
jgi:hypothetical protein